MKRLLALLLFVPCLMTTCSYERRADGSRAVSIGTDFKAIQTLERR